MLADNYVIQAINLVNNADWPLDSEVISKIDLQPPDKNRT